MNYINFKELLAVIVGSLPYFFAGFSYGFSSVYISQLNSETTVYSNEMSVIGGSGLALTFIGCMASGYLMDSFGRKSLLYAVYGFHSISWMIVATTSYFLLGRMLTGLAIGFGYGCVIYIAEVLQPQRRGAFLSIGTIFELVGILCVKGTGYYYIPVKTTSFVQSVFASILFACVFLIPETPYWYMMKRQKGKAIESLVRLRDGNELTIDFEIDRMETNLGNACSQPTFAAVIFNLRWWKMFLFFSVYMMLFELTAFNMIISYSTQFFDAVGCTGVDGSTMSILFMISALAGTVLTFVIAEKFQRTSLVKYTCLASALILAVAAMVAETSFRSRISSTLSVACYIIYGATLSITAFTFPWTIISENLPTDSRATVFAALCTEFAVVNFLFVAFFPLLLSPDLIGYVTWSLVLVLLSNYIFVSLFIKETKATILP